jgi:ElaB/YqjD/DUF883 family membrane-anchored ribosome-binding protein
MLHKARLWWSYTIIIITPISISSRSRLRIGKAKDPSEHRPITITLENERGYFPMVQSVFEHAGQQIDDTTHKATRAVSAVTDALEDGVIAARRMARDGTDAATELLYNARRRCERHPFETVAITFAVGIAAGTAIGWMLKRGKPTQRCE